MTGYIITFACGVALGIVGYPYASYLYGYAAMKYRQIRDLPW
jgi:hypothetical protein